LRATFRPGQKVCSDEEGNVYTLFETNDYSEVVSPAEPDDPTGPSIQRFPEPIPAVWRNQDADKPIRVIARMFESGLPVHYLTDENFGVPAAEVFFENEAQRSVCSAP